MNDAISVDNPSAKMAASVTMGLMDLFRKVDCPEIGPQQMSLVSQSVVR
jgi:hypothetical protein